MIFSSVKYPKFDFKSNFYRFFLIAPQYEHVAKEGAKFASVNGKAIELNQTRTSQTLLRDFDPIFEPQKVDKIVEQESDEDDTSSVASSSSDTSASEVAGAASLMASQARQDDAFELDPMKEDKQVWENCSGFQTKSFQ